MTKRVDPEGVEMEAIQKHVNFAGKEVLEIGCGDGRLTFRYADKAKRVIALDPDAESLKMAKQNLNNALSGKLEFREGKGEDLPFPEGSFDIVFFTYSLCCIDIPSMSRALTEALRVLREDGIVISVQPSLLQPFRTGVVSFLLTGIFGDEEDERFRSARIALKKLALLEGKLTLSAEETRTVNYWYDTQEEALEDVIRKKREQYDKLSDQAKLEVRKQIGKWATSDAVVLQEDAVFSFFTKALRRTSCDLH